MGFYWGTCFTRQNYSLTLNHVKHFPLFCHCYFLIFNYDLYHLLKPVKICFFLKKMSLYMEGYWAWYVLGPDTNTGNTMMTPSLFCPPVWISKGGIKKNSRNIFFKFSPNLFRKAVYIDKGWAVTFSWYLPMSLSDFTPALVWWVDYTMKANVGLSWGRKRGPRH